MRSARQDGYEARRSKIYFNLSWKDGRPCLEVRKKTDADGSVECEMIICAVHEEASVMVIVILFGSTFKLKSIKLYESTNNHLKVHIAVNRKIDCTEQRTIFRFR